MPKLFTEEERRTIRGKLLDAGLRRLEHSRWSSIAVEEIAAEAGIAKGTFYHFFPSKEAYFYEIMQCIKERNRADLRALLREQPPTREELVDCLYCRYTQMKTVYDYFTPEEIKRIVRRLPEGDQANDSEEFAALLCSRLTGRAQEKKAAAAVGMCNILGLASANRALFDPEGYAQAVRVFCNALADHILEGETP